MIRLILCNKCGYIGDLSDLPGDPEVPERADYGELFNMVAEGFEPAKEMFARLGWKRLPNGDDLCPKCEVSHDRP